MHLAAFADFPQQGLVAAASLSSAQLTAYNNKLGQRTVFPDTDYVAGVATNNGPTQRRAVLVKNGSGGTLACGEALNWVANYWGTRVQKCPSGSQIRGFVPAYINGSQSNTIADGDYFWMVYEGLTSVKSDGSSLAIDDGLVVGAASGQVATDYGLGGGLIYAADGASTAVTASSTPTKFDKSYTFPANSLRAVDAIRVVAQGIATATNSTDTLTLELMIGSTVIASTGAIDVANNDSFTFMSDIDIRTIGASGTFVATTLINTATGNATFKSIILGSTAIDTTATQQLAVRATWSTTNAGNSCRLDVLNISRLSTTSAGLRGGIAVATVAGSGSAVLSRAKVNCLW